MATDYRQARTIRLFVSAMRRRFREANGMVTQIDFDHWCDWALAQADVAGDDLVQTFAGNGLASQQFLCDIANRCPVALHECNGLVAKLVRDRRPLGSHVLMTCSSPRLSHQK